MQNCWEVMECGYRPYSVDGACPAANALGPWLKAHSQPNDTVLTETLGFIGYYASHNGFIDWPGLSSKDVI